MQFDVITWLASPALTLGATRLSIAEVLGFVTGLWCVWLAARAHIANFPVGIANCALLLFLFFHAGLFADAALQLLFISLGVRGWIQWSRLGRLSTTTVSSASFRLLTMSVLLAATMWAAFVPLLHKAGGSLPLFDALIASLSVVAQWWLNRKILQSWWWWIAVDLISIPVYVARDLYLIALLYCVFLGLCIFGYRGWRAELHRSRSAPAPLPA
jgi:nicotinamide mononucleotide transporter